MLVPVTAVRVPPEQLPFFAGLVVVPEPFLFMTVMPVGALIGDKLSVTLTLDRLVSEGAVTLMVS